MDNLYSINRKALSSNGYVKGEEKNYKMSGIDVRKTFNDPIGLNLQFCRWKIVFSTVKCEVVDERKVSF